MENKQDLSRFSDWGDNIRPILNENLQCADCLHKTDEIAACNRYICKPGAVLDGECCCPEYKKSED